MTTNAVPLVLCPGGTVFVLEEGLEKGDTGEEGSFATLVCLPLLFP